MNRRFVLKAEHFVYALLVFFAWVLFKEFVQQAAVRVVETLMQ